MFDGLLSLLEDESNKKSAEVNKEEDNDLLKPTITREELWEAMYIQACYWSFGASIVNDARLKFDECIKKICGLMQMQDTSTKQATISKFKKENK
jgi:hypothetical protein